MKKIRIIDLFSGIGGIRLGVEQACSELKVRAECVFSSEIDKYACRTYSENFSDMPVGDITQISEDDIADHDILLAGFPCQAFSIAGLRNGFNDTRGTLFFDVARILKAKKPQSFILENVKGLLNHDGGRTFNTIVETLESLGYHISYQVLSAKDFGLPQNRQRVYIIGFTDKEKQSRFRFPLPMDKETKVGDILENLDEVQLKRYMLSIEQWEYHKQRKIRNKENGKGFGFQLFTKNSQYTATLSARYYKDGSEIFIEVPERLPRRLTPRECARLQGFPENYKIVVSNTQAYKQFGNSVSVPVIKEVAKMVLKALMKKE